MSQSLAIAAARFWRERPQETVLAGALALAGIVALAGSAGSTPTLSGLPGQQSAPPAPPPLLVRQLAPQDALAINRSIPLAEGPNPAAQPFALAKLNEATYARALECLTSAVYYEAGNEAVDGQRAVAQVVLNRVRHPAFPASICGVVYEGSTRVTGCQFTFTCDGSLRREPSTAEWNRARVVAQAALAGYVYKPVGNATHYHANYVVPYWASTLTKSAVVGAHIFYRWASGWGRPAAFTQRYARAEPNARTLRAAALAALASRPAPQQQEVAEAVQEIPGAEALPLKPSMRGDKRVAVRFNLTARKAADAAPSEDFLKKVKASDNLRWTLTGGSAEAEATPLGRSASAAGAVGASPQ
jgi:spore germination cell wall hydrolase CwlJ-like protein